nr:hypothetical protein [Tanacetum cinerariifolium]
CYIENPSYFEKAKDLRPTLYDEKVIGLGYTPMFLTYSDEALEIKKFKRSRENKIEFAYDYENLNASYVNEKINFKDDYFQEIINPDFEKIDSPFQQTSSLKPYVPNVILEKIIIDLEDEVVNLLKNKKMNDLLHDNNFFIFDDVNVRISPVSKMPFRKKPRDSMNVKENQEKDKIGSKPDKNGKRGEAGRSLKQLQLKEEEKPKKTKKEWPKTHARIKSY